MVKFNHSLARIAVWNLAGFNPTNANAGVGLRSKRLERQAEGLALLDAELVTLVEVSPVKHIERLAAILAEDYGIDYQVAILPQPEGNIHIGFLHKPGVEISDLEFIDDSEGSQEKGRRAIKANVKIGKFKAIIIGVHLKSGRRAPQQAIRDTQCQVIGDHIMKLRKTRGLTRRTILLMGDFNMIPGQDVSNFHYLGGEDVMDFVSCWDLQDRFSHILDKGRANLLDGFAVSRTYSTAYVKGSLRLFPMHWTMNLGRAAFKKNVSDHLPFVASFRIYK